MKKRKITGKKKKANSYKTEKVNTEQKNNLNARLNLVAEACKQLIDDGEEVCYASVSRITQIRKRTLEHKHYAEVINRYRHNEVPDKKEDEPDSFWKKEAMHYQELYEIARDALESVKRQLVLEGRT